MPRLSAGKLEWRFLAPIARSVLFCSERRPSYRVACCGCLPAGRLLFRERERSEQSPPGTGSHTRGNLYQGVHAQSNDTSFVGRSLSLRTALKPIAGNSGACQHWELTAEVSHQTPPVALPTPQHPPRSRRTDNNHQDYGWQNCSRQAVTGTTDTHEDGHTTGGGTAGFFSKTKKCGSNPRHMDNDPHARLTGPRPV